VGQAAWGVVRWGPSVRVYNIYIATRADDPPVERVVAAASSSSLHTHTQVVSMQSCTHPCTDPLLLIIIIIIMVVVMARSVGWWAGQSELQRTSGGHRTKCALRNRVLYFTTCVCVCVCIYIYTHTHTHATTTNGGKVRACCSRGGGTYFNPSTSDGSFAAGHTHTHTHVHNTRRRRRHNSGGVACVVGACVVCEPVVGPRPSMWPVIGTSEALLLLEREPNAHTHDTTRHARTHTYVCVRVRVTSRASVQATRTKTILSVSLSIYISI
jgi:hypothetical protein